MLAASTHPGEELGREDYLSWHRILAKRGWSAISWPKEWGGTGWTPTQKYIWSEEQAKADTIGILPFGVAMLAPVIYTFGTEEQKARFLPGIASGELGFSVGLSEPGAGSDLAAIRTQAVGDGDRPRGFEYQPLGTTLPRQDHGAHRRWQRISDRSVPRSGCRSHITFVPCHRSDLLVR